MSTGNVEKEVGVKIERRIESWPVSKLQPHPKQSQIFGAVSLREIERLAKDIKANGLLNPIEVTEDGTIICGHQRLSAVIRLGWTEVQVWVRVDLSNEAAVTRRFIKDNVNRRQLSLLAKARAFRALKSLKKSDPDHSCTAGRTRREELARELDLGVSGKTLERLEWCLTLPIELQEAVDNHTLPMTRALLVTKLSKARQAQIVNRVTEGEPVNDVVKEALEQASDAEQLRRLARPRRRYDIEKDMLKGLRAMREYGGLEQAPVDAALAQALQESRPVLMKLLRLKPE